MGLGKWSHATHSHLQAREWNIYEISTLDIHLSTCIFMQGIKNPSGDILKR